jgi:hypothetical protein
MQNLEFVLGWNQWMYATEIDGDGSRKTKENVDERIWKIQDSGIKAEVNIQFVSHINSIPH